MFNTFIQVVFGWPAITVTILLSITGLILKKPVLLIIAGFLCMPFTYYVSNGLRNPIVLLPFLEFACAYAITRQWKVIAWLLIAPLVTISTMLAYAVLTQ
jgi:hypothetical protein